MRGHRARSFSPIHYAIKDPPARIRQPLPEGPVLVYVVEAADFDRGAAAFAASEHPIDAEHRAGTHECVRPALDIHPLYDVSAS